MKNRTSRRVTNKKNFSHWIIIASLIVATFLSWKIYHSADIQKRLFYPFPYKEDIEENSRINNVDRFLVLSIIKVESGFDCTARSKVGALGLMQLMPETGAWIAGEFSEPKFSPAMLYQPLISIRFGSWYIKSLLKEFDGNIYLALAAYNAGRGNVHDWMAAKGWSKAKFARIEEIPYPETRAFVRKVLAAEQQYKQLYGSK